MPCVHGNWLCTCRKCKYVHVNFIEAEASPVTIPMFAWWKEICHQLSMGATIHGLHPAGPAYIDLLKGISDPTMENVQVPLMLA